MSPRQRRPTPPCSSPRAATVTGRWPDCVARLDVGAERGERVVQRAHRPARAAAQRRRSCTGAADERGDRGQEPRRRAGQRGVERRRAGPDREPPLPPHDRRPSPSRIDADARAPRGSRPSPPCRRRRARRAARLTPSASAAQTSARLAMLFYPGTTTVGVERTVRRDVIERRLDRSRRAAARRVGSRGRSARRGTARRRWRRRARRRRHGCPRALCTTSKLAMLTPSSAASVNTSAAAPGRSGIGMRTSASSSGWAARTGRLARASRARCRRS